MRRAFSIWGVICAAGLVGLAATQAYAQFPGGGSPRGGARGFGPGRSAFPPTARYVIENSVSFVFDQSGPQPLVRFEGSREVLALSPQPAPRGDVVFKTDTGETVLRASRFGGMTVFTPTRPEGAPASLAGAAAPIRLDTINDLVEFGLKLRAASARASRAAGNQVIFDAPDFGPESAVVLADAANLTAEAFEKAATKPETRLLLRNIDGVEFIEGSAASVVIIGRILRVTIAGARGAGGRPSSERITRLLASAPQAAGR